MNPIALAFSEPLTITLAHFVWEGALIGLLTALAAVGIRGRSPQSRYAVYLTGMLLMAACLPVTFAYVVVTSQPTPENSFEEANPSEIAQGKQDLGEFADPATVNPPVMDSAQRPGLPTVVESSTPTVSLDVNERTAEGTAAIPSDPNWLERLSPYVAAAYWLGLTLMLLRIAVSLYGGHRFRRDAVALSGQELEIVHGVAKRIGLCRVPFVGTCRRVSGPVVIGMLRPVVLLPAMLVSGLSAQQLETVLAHEFTHLRRYDHWVLMFQRLSEALLFFHPAVWYISRGLSNERENCCDDAVIAAGTPRVAYAELLVKIAEQRTLPHPTVTALAASGGKPSRLRLRVLRLLDPPPDPILRLGRPQALGILGVLAAFVLVPVLGYVFAQSPVANENGQAANAEESRPKETDEAKWGEPLKGLRVRLSAPNGNQYHRGKPLPLLIELQNVSAGPIAFSELQSTYDIKVYTETGDWLGIARSHVAISPWEGARGEFAPQQILKWHIGFDRLRLNKPITAGSSVDVRVSVPQQIVEPGKLPRSSYSPPVRLKLIDALPTVREADDSPPQLKAGDVLHRWTETMDLVYRETGGLERKSRAIQIDGQGRVTMLNCGSPGRKETKLGSDRLDALASRLQQIRIWELSKISWREAFANPDEPEMRVLLAYGGASINGDYAFRLIRSNETLKSFQSEMLAVIDDALKAEAIDNAPGEAAVQGPPQSLAKISRTAPKEPAIVWGDPIGGLAVGLGDVSTSLKSPVRPIITAYLENRGPNTIESILPYRTSFILELDGQFSAEGNFGGPLHDLKPGERIGPITITTSAFHKVKDLKSALLVDQTRPGPDLADGEHTLRIHYGQVASGTIKLKASLSPYPIDEAVEMIDKELEDRDRDVRRDAALAAGKLGLAGCRESLEKVLDDNDKVIRRYAAESLGKIGDPAAIQSLPELLKDDQMEVRLAAAESLVELGVPLETKWVEPVIRSKDSIFQNAIWLVRRHGGKAAVPALIRCLDVKDPAVNNYYNYTLIWQIHACGGPDLKYHHDFDNKGTPEEVEENRKVLAKLTELLKKPGKDDAEANNARDAKKGADQPFATKGPATLATAQAREMRLIGDQVRVKALDRLAGKHWGKVSLRDAKFDGAIIEKLRESASIQTLELTGTGLSGQLPRLGHINNLSALIIGESLTGNDLEALGELGNLTSLSFTKSFTINQAGGHELARLTNLKSLSLYNINIDDSAFAELKTLNRLEELDLSHTRITDLGLAPIASMPRLRKLELYRHPARHIKQQLTDKCVLQILKLTELEHLSLSGEVSDEGFQKVLQLPNLKFVSITGTNVTAKGLSALKESKVSSLSLSFSQLGSISSVPQDASAQEILQQVPGLANLRKSKNLKQVHVHGQHLRMADYEILRRAIPEISWLFSS